MLEPNLGMGFIDLGKESTPKPIPRPADDLKKRAAAPVSAVSSDGSDDYRSKLRAMRPVAYGLLAFWLAAYAVFAYFAGWL